MYALAMANQKGGVGKTTVSLMLAARWASEGRRVVLVDCDPQASASQACDVPEEVASLVDVLEGDVDVASAVVRVETWGFDLVPSDIGLAKLEQAGRQPGAEYRLRERLAELTGSYDVCLLDCPPNLGLMTLMALTAADGIAVVTEPTLLSLRGLQDLEETVETVVRYYNADLAQLGIVVNMLDRTRTAQDRLAELQAAYEGVVLEPPLPRRVGAKEWIEGSAPAARGMQDPLNALAGELAARIGLANGNRKVAA